MKVGLQIYHFDWPGAPRNTGARLVEIAKTAENAGFFSLWVMDHLFQLGGAFGAIESPLIEAYSAITYMASATKRVKLGVLVTNNICRHPSILLKVVNSLDVLSEGRAYLGIGLGGMIEQEMRGMGIPQPSLKDRIERLEETLKIFKHIWKGDTSPFLGNHFQLEHPINNPKPLSKPHPPILIGMWEGGKKMLQLTAKYADACNLQFGSPLKEFAYWMRARYEVRRKFLTSRLERLKQNCEQLGRSYDEIEKTVLGTIRIAPDAMSEDSVIDLCRELTDLGFQHVIFNMPNVHEIKPLEIIGDEVIPVVAEFEKRD